MRVRRRAPTLGVQPMNPSKFNALNFLDPFLSSPFQPPVCLTHLVAWKGRKASDRCGGGGRSSGNRRAGVTRAVRGLPSLGSPPAVGVERGSARDLPKARALVVRDLLETADPGSG
jgi:hypothetical protein